MKYFCESYKISVGRSSTFLLDRGWMIMTVKYYRFLPGDLLKFQVDVIVDIGLQKITQVVPMLSS